MRNTLHCWKYSLIWPHTHMSITWVKVSWEGFPWGLWKFFGHFSRSIIVRSDKTAWIHFALIHPKGAEFFQAQFFIHVFMELALYTVMLEQDECSCYAMTAQLVVILNVSFLFRIIDVSKKYNISQGHLQWQLKFSSIRSRHFLVKSAILVII